MTHEKLTELAPILGKVGSALKCKKWQSREKFVADITATRINLTKGELKKVIDTVGIRDENAEICKDASGNPEPDSELRDTENVPWGTDVYAYFKKEVKPYALDAWLNESIKDEKDNKIGKVGYEIPFTRFFYQYEPPRELGDVEGDIEKVENELLALLKQL